MSALWNGEGIEVVTETYNSTRPKNPDYLNQKIPVEEDAPEIAHAPSQETLGTVCCLKKKVFWTLVGVGTLLVAIVIAVVLAVLLTKKTNVKSTATTTLTNTTTSSNTIFDGSSLAAIAFGTTLQSFYQNKDGNIFYETQDGEKVVDGPAVVPALVGAKVGTPLASVSWSNGQQIRLYYLSNLNELQDHSYSNGLWTQGNLSTMGIRALETSQLTAITYGDNEIRLYFQVSNGAIQEYTWGNESWVISQSLPIGTAGTGLAAIYLPPTDIRVYYQMGDHDLTIHQMGYGSYSSGTWVQDDRNYFNNTFITKGRLAATYWKPNIRLFYHPPGSNSIVLYSWLGTVFAAPVTIVKNISVTNGPMSAVSPAIHQFRLVYQDTTNSFTDLWTVE